LYSNEHVAGWLKFIIGLVFSLVYSSIFYKIAAMHWNDPAYDENLTDLKTLISIEKKITKNKATDEQKEQRQKCKDCIHKRLTEQDEEGDKKVKHMNKSNLARFTKAYVKLDGDESKDAGGLNNTVDEEETTRGEKLMQLE
jgi:hypothetical protein